MRGRPPKLSLGDKHEVRRYREAGVSITHLGEMWGLSRRRIHEVLAEMRVRLGPERLPKHKRHLVRLNSRRSDGQASNSTEA